MKVHATDRPVGTGDSGIEHVDVLVVGAGLAGIDAAYRLQTRCPHLDLAILEARQQIGGTWDLFRYPGVRSDSDMHTLGFPFRPWRGRKAIADGDDIQAYIEETARRFGIDRKIRFDHRVVRARWSSPAARWEVDVEVAGKTVRIASAFLYFGSGYYDYASGHQPGFPGLDRFNGKVIHPQFWPAELDVRGKRIIVVGSGATAVTLVPSLARHASHVTMLQRSPTYVVSRPSIDHLANVLLQWLPAGIADGLTRWKSILYTIATYHFSRRHPARVRKVIIDKVRRELPGLGAQTHFSPSYDPWDQRVCLATDGDLFAAIREGRAWVVTGQIASFDETGVNLGSGEHLPADIIVTATGLEMKLFGGAELWVDGERVDPAKRVVYKGMMLSEVPNLALAFGYTNASWTLKCDLTARQVCRLLNHMARKGMAVCTPRYREPGAATTPLFDLTSGYVRRAAGILPRQGGRPPWRVHQNYVLDLFAFRFSPIEDKDLEFTP